MIQPIVVRPLDGNSRDGYEIVAGERRWRAAQLAGMSTVPAIIRSLDEQRTALYSLAENIARSDLNPMELANGYQSVLDHHGCEDRQSSAAALETSRRRPAIDRTRMANGQAWRSPSYRSQSTATGFSPTCSGTGMERS